MRQDQHAKTVMYVGAAVVGVVALGFTLPVIAAAVSATVSTVSLYTAATAVGTLLASLFIHQMMGTITQMNRINNLYKAYKYQPSVFLIAILTSFLGLMFTIITRKSLGLVFLLLGIEIVLIVVSRIILNRILAKVNNLIEEDIDFASYLTFYQMDYNSSTGLRKRNALRNLYFAKSRVLYYTGKFENCLLELDKMDQTIVNKMSQSSPLQAGLLRILAKIQLNLDYESDLSNFSERVVKGDALNDFKNSSLVSINRISTIEKGNVIENLDFGDEVTKLASISQKYYNALNEVNSGNLSNAIIYFSEIKDENSELFYVKEAIKFLEENK